MNVMSSSFGAPTLEAQVRMSVELDTSSLEALRDELGKFEDVSFKIGAAVEESTKKVGEGVDDAVDKVDTGIEVIQKRIAKAIGWATALVTSEMADLSAARENTREFNEHLREEIRLTSELATKGAQVSFAQADTLAQKMADRMGTTKGVFKKSMDEMAGMGLPNIDAWEKAWTRYADIAAKKGESVEEAVQAGRAASRSPSAEVRYLKSILGDDVQDWAGRSEASLISRFGSLRKRPGGALALQSDADEYIDRAAGFMVPHPFTGKQVHIGEAMGAVGDKEDLVAEAQKKLRIQKGEEQSKYIEKLNEEHAAAIKLATAAYKSAAASADVIEATFTGAIEGGLGGMLAGTTVGLLGGLAGGPIGAMAGALSGAVIGGGFGVMSGAATRGGVALGRVGVQEGLTRNPETGALEFRSPVGDLFPGADATPPPTGAADPNSPWNNVPKLPPMERPYVPPWVGRDVREHPAKDLPIENGKLRVTLEGETVKTAPLTPEARAANAVRSNPPQTDLKPWTDMRDQETVEAFKQRKAGGVYPTEESQRRLEGRAAGGPVAAGRPYVVGENGMELFVPSADGHIMPHARGSNPSSSQFGGMEWVHALQISTLDLNSFSLALKRATDQVEQITRQHGGGAGGGRYGSVGGAGVYGGFGGGAGAGGGAGGGFGGFRGAGASGSWGGGSGGGGGGGFRGGGGSFGGGGATGEASSYHGGAGTGSTPAHGKLAANQQEAYSTLRSLGYDEDTAKIVTANMSGESLANPANKHWDRSHYSQGIVQWDDVRSEAIRKQFGKYPKDMSVPEQVKAFDWEIKSKYKGAYAGLTDKSASLDQRMYSLVKKYEAPADASGQTRARMGLMRGLKVGDGAGGGGAAPTSEARAADPKAGVTLAGDLSGSATYARAGEKITPEGLIFHHTGGRGTPSGVVNTLNQRGLGVQYVMDRDGKVFQTLPEGSRAAHLTKAENRSGLSNANALGVEVIAKNDADITKAQIESGKRLAGELEKKYGFGTEKVFGHGEVNAHKQETEGHTIVEAIRRAERQRPSHTEIAHAKSTASQRPPPVSRPGTEVAHAQATQAGLSAQAKQADRREQARIAEQYYATPWREPAKLEGGYKFDAASHSLRSPANQLRPDSSKRNPLGLVDSGSQGMHLGRGQVDVNLKLDKGLQATTPNAKPATRFDLGVNIDRTGATTMARGGDPTFFNRGHL